MHPDKRPGDIWINLGCGVHLIGDFINVDNFFTLEDLQKKEGPFAGAIIEDGAQFVQADMRGLPFPDDYADYIMSIASVEHLDIVDVVPALREWKRVLKPDGELYVATVDFDELARIWLTEITGQPYNKEKYNMLSMIIYGNQVGQGEYHRVPFNQRYMAECFAEAGFPYFVMSIYDTNAEHPKIKGYTLDENRVQAAKIAGYDVKMENKTYCMTRELHVRAYKQVPDNVHLEYREE